MILAGPRSMPSARILRDSIENLTGRRLSVSTRYLRGTTVHVRYGSTLEAPGTCLMNSTAFISACSNKKRMADLLNANGLHAPVFQRNVSPSEYPVVVRETLSGFGGVGIHICNNAEEFAPYRNCWWTPFVRVRSEYRVHVLGGQVVRVFKKVPQDETVTSPIRNMHNGYHFSLVNMEGRFENLLSTVAQMTPILNTNLPGAGFYGLDIAWTEDRQYFIFELNSAPGLANDNTAELYAQYVVDQLGW